MTKHKFTTRFLVAGATLGMIVIAIAILPAWDQAVPANLAVAQVTAPVAPPREFPAIELQAKAAVVFDMEKGEELYQKNASTQLPLASITKIMTALVAYDLFSPVDIISISQSALAGGTNAGLVADDAWQMKNLVDYKLTTSSNGAAAAIAEAGNLRTGGTFITKMNDKARALGLLNTYFINETGLDVGELYGGSYGTARDIAKLVAYIVSEKPDLMAATVNPRITATSATGRTYTGVNTNEIVSQIPGLLASKTGFTNAAGGNLVIAFDRGLRQPVVIVVLGSTKEGRFSDVLKLVNATMDYYAENTL